VDLQFLKWTLYTGLHLWTTQW